MIMDKFCYEYSVYVLNITNWIQNYGIIFYIMNLANFILCMYFMYLLLLTGINSMNDI